jgi:ribose transport system permease protein
MSTADVAIEPPPAFGRSAVALLRGVLRRYSFAYALLLTVVLLIANLLRVPRFGWNDQLANFAPLALAGMASAPAIISGGGGFDMSVSPLMILTTVIFVSGLAAHGLGGPEAIPILLAVGAAVGTLNGVLILVLRVAPVVVTLSMYFVLIGLNLRLAPSPVSTSPGWMAHLAGSVGPIPGALLTVGFPLLVWALLGRLPYRRTLYAVGSNDATAYSAGVNVGLVRIVAYALGGMFAAVGGITLLALSSSASSSLATTYTLQAIAAVALGGTSLWGGRGGLMGPVFGAASLYLLSNLLVTVQVPPAWLQVIYGGMLLVAVVLVSVAGSPEKSK